MWFLTVLKSYRHFITSCWEAFQHVLTGGEVSKLIQVYLPPLTITVKNIPPKPNFPHVNVAQEREKKNSINNFQSEKEEKCSRLVAMIYHAELLGCDEDFPWLFLLQIVLLMRHDCRWGIMMFLNGKDFPATSESRVQLGFKGSLLMTMISEIIRKSRLQIQAK